MNWALYFKLSPQEYKAYLKEEELEKLYEQSSKLVGEITGLEEKIKVYELARPTLVLSNHVDIGQMQEQVYAKIARRTYLEEKIERIREAQHKDEK